MAKKTVFKRLAKRLPTSADVQSLIERDNDDYEVSAVSNKSKEDAFNERFSSPLELEEPLSFISEPEPTPSVPSSTPITDKLKEGLK
jgi:recombinational DNA repair protein RecT